MKQKIIQSLVMALSSLVLLGCGGSSDNNDDPKVTLTGTGYYVDSAVAGVEYVCGTKSGTTDSSGEFVFDIGSGCVFKVAGVTLRETSSDKLKDKVTIFENNETVARFLQSIDNDGNTSNGIQIDKKILDVLTNALKTHSENKIPKDTETLTNVVGDVKGVAEFKGEVKSEEEVKTHLAKTEASIFRTEIAGKTFYFNDQGAITELKFNADLTKLTKNGIEENIKFENNKLILLDDDNKYLMLNEKIADYLLVGFYSSDGTIRDTPKLYFDKAKAEASLNGGGSGQTANIDPSILAGKTFYFVSELMVESDTFNEDMTLVTWENIYGVGDSNKVLGNKGTSSFHVEDNKAIFDKGGYFYIQEMTDTFVIFWDGTKQMKYYLNLDEAKAVYESMKSGSTSTTTPTGTDFKAELAGKTFYILDKDDGVSIIKTVIFNNDVTIISGTKIDGTKSISLVDNKLILLDDDNMYFMLKEKTTDYLLLDFYSHDGIKDGDDRFYFDKAKAEVSLSGGGSGQIEPTDLSSGTYIQDDNTINIDGASLNMNSSNPPILQFNLKYYTSDGKDMVQINTIYTSKEEFDNKFSNNSLIIDSNNGSVGMEIAGQGWVGNDSVSSDFQVEVIKNSDGTYNLTSKGHFISSGRTIKDIKVIKISSH